jgi:hypothetical protein
MEIMMKILCAFLLFLIVTSFSLHAQIKVSTDFESASLGDYQLLDSLSIATSNETTIPIYSLLLTSRTDPINPVDTSLRPSPAWYYFRLEGVKNKFVFLKIQNFQIPRPFYSYNGKDFFRFDKGKNFARGMISKYFTEDTVYIASFIPYTMTKLYDKINDWDTNDFVSVSEIGHSGEGKTMHMLTITDKSINDINKKSVWIHGRAHPSESPGTYHLEALIDLITSESRLAKELRKQVVFYIVPIINPDGVFGGYARSSSNGVNIEINWDRPDSLTNSEVKVLKSKINELSNIKPFELLLNMHSQRDHFVSYWIHTATSTSKKFLKKEMLLSSLTMGDDQLLYRPEDQRYSNILTQYIEGQIWKRFKDTTLALTFETPYTFYREDGDGDWVSLQNLKALAENSLHAICDYLNIKNSQRLVIDNPAKANKSFSKISEPDKIFFGNDYLVASKKGNKLVYSFDNLKKGTYNIYRWQPGINIEKSETEAAGQWVKYGTHNQTKNGKFTYTITSVSAGEIFDAIQLRANDKPVNK